MLSTLLLTLCTKVLCEEYVIDHNLTKSDCIERKREEVLDMKGESFNQIYKDAVTRFKAVPMDGKIVSVKLNCFL